MGHLVGLQGREALDYRAVRAQEEAAGAAGRVADAMVRSGQHHVDDGRDEPPRCEVLARSPGALLGGLLDQTLVGGALQVGVVAEPLVLVDEVLDELLQLGRGLDAVAGLAEDHAEHVVACPQLREDLAVVGFERGPRAAQQRLPVVLDGHDPLTAQQIVLLVGHLQEQQVGELLQVVAVGQPVVAQHIAEVPQSLHQRLGVVTRHHLTLRRRHRRGVGFHGRSAWSRSSDADPGGVACSCMSRSAIAMSSTLRSLAATAVTRS